MNVAGRITKAVGQPAVEAVLVTRVVQVAATAWMLRILPVEGVVVVLGSNALEYQNSILKNFQWGFTLPCISKFSTG